MYEQFTFNKPLDKNFRDCDRANTANFMCKLLYNKYEGDLDKLKTSNDLLDLSDHLHEHIRNLYELIDMHIPLLAYYDLHRHLHKSDWDDSETESNWDFTKQEYEQALANTIAACKVYYE